MTDLTEDESGFISRWLFKFLAHELEKQQCSRHQIFVKIEQTVSFCFSLTAIKGRQPRKLFGKMGITSVHQYYFWRRKTSLKTRVSLGNNMGTLTINFGGKNVVYWISLWLHREEWRRPPSCCQYTWNLCEIWGLVLANRTLTGPEIVVAVSMSHGSVFSIMNEKSIHKLGADSARNWSQIQSCINFEGVFGVVQLQSGRVFAPFHNSGGNMDSLHYTGEQVCFS